MFECPLVADEVSRTSASETLKCEVSVLTRQSQGRFN